MGVREGNATDDSDGAGGALNGVELNIDAGLLDAGLADDELNDDELELAGSDSSRVIPSFPKSAAPNICVNDSGFCDGSGGVAIRKSSGLISVPLPKTRVNSPDCCFGLTGTWSGTTTGLLAPG